MLFHKKSLTIFIGVIIVFSNCILAIADIGKYEEAAFDACSQLRKAQYKELRDLLLEKGRELLPLLGKKEKSPDFNQRQLARILRLYIEQPEVVKDWKDKLVNSNLFKIQGKLLENKYSPIYKQRVNELNEEKLPAKGYRDKNDLPPRWSKGIGRE